MPHNQNFKGAILPTSLAVLAGLLSASFTVVSSDWSDLEPWWPAITYGVAMAGYFWVTNRRWFVPLVVFGGIAASWYFAVTTAIAVYSPTDSYMIAGMAGGAVGIVIYLGALLAVLPRYRNWRSIIPVLCVGSLAGVLVEADSYFILTSVWQGLVTFTLVYCGNLKTHD